MHPLSENGTIAQLVEQRTENPCVPGSIPGGTTHKKHHRSMIYGVSLFYVIFQLFLPSPTRFSVDFICKVNREVNYKQTDLQTQNQITHPRTASISIKSAVQQKHSLCKKITF